MLQTDDRQTGLRSKNIFLALLSLLLMSFCTIPSLLITLPRYVKLSTLSIAMPAIVRSASKFVQIYITFVFGELISSPTCLSAYHTSALSRICAREQIKTARSFAQSRLTAILLLYLFIHEIGLLQLQHYKPFNNEVISVKVADIYRRSQN